MFTPVLGSFASLSFLKNSVIYPYTRLSVHCLSSLSVVQLVNTKKQGYFACLS